MHDHSHKTPALIQISGIETKPTQPKPEKPHDHSTKLFVGLDVGSTTVKAIVVDAATDQILWQDYQRQKPSSRRRRWNS
jgi:activator of 2-hydroxyglutaryl-CoA dehydratase